MTTVLGNHTFSNPQPLITIGGEVEAAAKPKLFAGTTLDIVSVGNLAITLSGTLMGSSKTTDRDTILTDFKAGTKVNFYSEEASYGTSGSPKSVVIKSVVFVHPEGGGEINYEIVLLEET